MAENLTTIRVRALRSFAARIGETSWSIRKGHVYDLPPTADWLRAGLVELVEAPKSAAEPPASVSVETPVETATVAPPEQAVSKRERSSRSRSKAK